MPEHAHENQKPQSVRKQSAQPPLQNLGLSEPRVGDIQRAQQNPSALRPAEVLMLQRAIGNQAVQRVINAQSQSAGGGAGHGTLSSDPRQPAPMIQPKLKVGPARDQYEEEADRVARQVVNTPHRVPPAQGVQPKRLLQRTTENGFEASGDFEHQLQRTKGNGKPLPAQTRAEFETSFGADFSKVRIHTGSTAKQLNQSIQAKAFTHGNDIHFGAGEFNPNTSAGKHLLAHELTHTIQQTGGEKLQRKEIASIPSALRPNKEISSAPAVTIQRRMNFAAADLQGNLSFGARFKGFFGAESTWAQLTKELANYENADGPAEELASLQVLKQLGQQWLTRHDKDKKKDGTKERSIQQLLTEIDVEIPKVQQRIADDAEEQDEYIRKIEAKSLKYVTASGLRIAKNVKDWHSGKDLWGQQAVNANQLIKTHNLTLAEATAIGLYTADDYKYMNPAMAKNEGWMRAMLPKTGFAKQDTFKEVHAGVTDQHVQEATEEGQLHGKIAVSGMKKLPDWTGQTYRGLALPESDFSAMYPLNGTTVFPAFSSTSLNEATSRGFARTNATDGKVAILLRLQLTRGKDIATLSNSPGEAEILLMPGATFKVAKIREEQYKNNKMYVVDLKQQK